MSSRFMMGLVVFAGWSVLVWAKERASVFWTPAGTTTRTAQPGSLSHVASDRDAIVWN